MSATSVPGAIPAPVGTNGVNPPKLGSIPELEQDDCHGQGPQPADAYSLRAEVHRLNNRNLTEQGKQLGQYVRNLYDTGEKLFNKDTFQEVENVLAADPRPAIVQIRSSTLRRSSAPSPTSASDSHTHHLSPGLGVLT